ncbi:hypothetical protein CCACVL1_13925 [Corchorus capsularis]|uniref:Uncharacterized protein n=1 Tax=Corchorus capsularis TaxID=210143 RepID=A0A1R3I8Y4_COCAP|nr:hypothetical protein CCACVL1_13925 [Corchorus capsularis]
MAKESRFAPKSRGKVISAH